MKKKEIETQSNKDSPRLAKIALIVSMVAGFLGIFGGVPGIKTIFFNSPSIEIQGLMPTVVFDEGYDLQKDDPKFSLKGLLKVSNPNDHDISISEMKLYGITRATSGYHWPNSGQPLVYRLNVAGVLDSKEDVIKARATGYLRFQFAHFENTEEKGIMHPPMSAQGTDGGNPVFYIYTPTYDEIFKYNESRRPYEVVDELGKNELYFAVTFNNELIKIAPAQLLNLQHLSKEQWEKDETRTNTFNAAREMKSPR